MNVFVQLHPQACQLGCCKFLADSEEASGSCRLSVTTGFHEIILPLRSLLGMQTRTLWNMLGPDEGIQLNMVDADVHYFQVFCFS